MYSYFYIIRCFLFSYIARPRTGRIAGRSANRQTITLSIYGESRTAIDSVKRAIEDLCKSECPDEVLDSEDDKEAISKLTQTTVIYRKAYQNGPFIRHHPISVPHNVAIPTHVHSQPPVFSQHNGHRNVSLYQQ